MGFANGALSPNSVSTQAASGFAESEVDDHSRKHYIESVRLKPSRHFQCGNSVELLSKLLRGPLQVVALLQIKPQVRTVAAQFP